MTKDELYDLASDIINDIEDLVDKRLENLSDEEKYFIKKEIKEYFNPFG